MAKNQENFLDQMFCAVDGVVLDIANGTIGVVNGNGGYIFFQKQPNKKPKLVTTPMGAGILALKNIYAIRAAPDQLALGDLLVDDNDNFCFFLSYTPAKDAKENADNAFIRVLYPGQNVTGNVVLPKHAIFGNEGILAVKSPIVDMKNPLSLLLVLDDNEDLASNPVLLMQLFNQMPKQAVPQQEGEQPAAEPNNLAAMLPLLLMMGDDDEDDKLKKLLPLLLMQGNGDQQQQNLLPLLLLSANKGGDSKISKLLPVLLAQNMGQDAAQNPLANPILFMSLLLK